MWGTEDELSASKLFFFLDSVDVSWALCHFPKDAVPVIMALYSILEEKISRTPFDINHSNTFFYLPLKEKEIKTKLFKKPTNQANNNR